VLAIFMPVWQAAGRRDAARRRGRSTPSLALPDGAAASIRVLQVRTPVDVIANDLLRVRARRRGRIAVEGPLFAAALAALARAAGVE
jgi:hypothetical protein